MRYPLTLITLIFAVGYSNVLHAQDYTADQIEQADTIEYYDDNTILLVVIKQSNGNTMEISVDRDLGELKIRETGLIGTAAPALENDELRDLSVLQAYLRLVPEEFPVPRDIVTHSRLSEREKELLIRDREIVEKIDAPIDIGDRLLANPSSACSSVGSGLELDWGPQWRQSACNAYSGNGSIKAKIRICNMSSGGHIRIALAYRDPGVWRWPKSDKHNVPAGIYDHETRTGVRKSRRARYSDWEEYYEQAIVGGYFRCGSNLSPTSVPCNVSHDCGPGGHLPL